MDITVRFTESCLSHEPEEVGVLTGVLRAGTLWRCHVLYDRILRYMYDYGSNSVMNRERETSVGAQEQRLLACLPTTLTIDAPGEIISKLLHPWRQRAQLALLQ